MAVKAEDWLIKLNRIYWATLELQPVLCLALVAGHSTLLISTCYLRLSWSGCGWTTPNSE